MAPLLIDSRDQLKLVFISAMTVVLVFASGFFIGHQRAAVFYQAGSVVQSLALPEHVATESVIDPLLPEKIEAGEDIDVDQPEVAVNARTVNQTPKEAEVNKKAAVLQKSDTIKVAEIKTEQKSAVVQKKENLESRRVEDNYGVYTQPDKQHGSSQDGLTVTAFTSDELSKIKYSIQVGTYGRLINAENMIEMLQAQKLEAYITNSTDKNNKVRYNVRYGYFPDKKSAITSLEKFKSDQRGDGYLVRFSAADIVDIADAAVINQPVNMPAQSDQSDKEITPTAPEITQDKISQADVLNDVLIKTN